MFVVRNARSTIKFRWKFGRRVRRSRSGSKEKQAERQRIRYDHKHDISGDIKGNTEPRLFSYFSRSRILFEIVVSPPPEAGVAVALKGPCQTP